MTRINNTGRVGADLGVGQGGQDAKTKQTGGLARSNAVRGTRTSPGNMAPRRTQSGPGALGRLETRLSNGFDATFGEQGKAPSLARRAGSALERGYDSITHSPTENLASFEGKLERGYDRLFSKSGQERLGQFEQKLADGHDQVFAKSPEQHLAAAKERLGGAAGRLQGKVNGLAADGQHAVTGDSSTVGHAFQTLLDGGVGDAATNFGNLQQAVKKSDVMNMSTDELGQAVAQGLDSAGKTISSAAGNAVASLSAWWNKT